MRAPRTPRPSSRPPRASFAHLLGLPIPLSQDGNELRLPMAFPTSSTTRTGQLAGSVSRAAARGCLWAVDHACCRGLALENGAARLLGSDIVPGAFLGSAWSLGLVPWPCCCRPRSATRCSCTSTRAHASSKAASATCRGGDATLLPRCDCSRRLSHELSRFGRAVSCPKCICA